MPNNVPPSKSVPMWYWRWWLVNSDGWMCSTWCKNYLLFQLSCCCDGKLFVFASILSFNIKIFSRLFFVPSLQKARYALGISLLDISKITRNSVGTKCCLTSSHYWQSIRRQIFVIMFHLLHAVRIWSGDDIRRSTSSRRCCSNLEFCVADGPKKA